MGRKRDIQIAEMVGKPIAEKMEQVEAAVRRDGEQTRAAYTKQIGEVKEVVDAVIADLSSREKKELYDLNTSVDIAELDDTEKEFLVAVLYTLAGMTEEVTESQQDYIRSVKRYLGVKDIQTDIDLSRIENIDSKKDERAILQCVMEFLFLENCDHSYREEYEDVLDYFSVKSREVRELETAINNIYNAIGEDGLAEKFGLTEEHEQNSIAKFVEEKIGQYSTAEEPIFFVWCTLNDSGSVSDMNYFGDDIHSRYEAERRAESRFSSFYAEAESYFNSYSNKSLADKSTEELLEKVKYDFIEITDKVNSLDAAVKERNAKAVEELLDLLDVDGLRQRIQDIADKELDRSIYKFMALSYYTSQISYSDMEHDPPGFFGKRDWWYDGMVPWIELEDELMKKSNDYFKYLSMDFCREVISPVIDLANRIK